MAAKISNERKATYYIGLGMIGLGFILFISFFFSVGSVMSNPMSAFEGHRVPFQNPVIGMILMIAGGIVSNIGARGAAGSGIVLDPERAREDLKPFNEAKGEMINDVLENVDIIDKVTDHSKAKEIIKIKCRNCGSLNDEDAKFCKSCGRDI